MERDDLSLLIPEWQGYGGGDAVAVGARAIAARFEPEAFVEIDAGAYAPLAVEDGVLGLGPIADTAAKALAVLAERRPSRIFTVAGTCGAELAPVSYLADRYRGDLAVVWFDAHGDLNTPASSPSGRFHGMVLRTLLGSGPAPLVQLVRRPLSPEQLLLAGVRDLDRDEAVFISDTSIARLAPADLLVPDRLIGRLKPRGFTRVYLHLDLDVLDPVEFPDALVPAPNGLAMQVLVDSVRSLAAAFDVVGLSVVELRTPTEEAASRVRRLLDRCGVQIGALRRTPAAAGL